MKQLRCSMQKRLLVILTLLTLAVIITQYVYFFLHHMLDHLDDSIIRSPLIHAFLRPLVIFPFVQYLSFQIVWYVFFITWIWLLSVTLQQRWQLSAGKMYLSGVVYWVLAVIAILALNNHFYPHSYFAIPNHPAFGTLALVISGVPLFMATVYAYLQVYARREHLVVAGALLLFVLWVLGSGWRDAFFALPFLAENAQLNVLLVGLSGMPIQDASATDPSLLSAPHIYL